ncbi:MAG: protein kinase, partial [Akkermansiaceae bacterium]|nr:protein kinase [Akkermansiaceae bacterium]
MPTKVRPEPTIPDHEVLRKIGGGAYGEVWLARGVTGAMRAAKVVWHDDFEDERGFEREFEGILKYEPISRDHPGLVHILHVGRGDAGEPFYYYVMELGDDVAMGREINPVEYEPRTLRSDMKSAAKQPLDTDFCIETGRRLAEALEHLHSNGLAHRDVKPSNVIFVDGKAKLADIGLVALRGQQTFVGTEGFVPPEGPGSAQADVYSLGKVLYEMATGMDRLDFPELPDELPTDHNELKRWRALNGAICDVCEPKISRRKIKTAGDLAMELGRLERGQGRPVRVSPALITGVALLGLLTVAGWAFLPVQPWQVTSVAAAGRGLPLQPDMGLVTVTSDPLGAEVYDTLGNYLADTPLRPQRVEVGKEVTYEFRLDGFQNAWAGGIVTPEGLVIEPVLKVYSPPVAGDPWEDIFGRPYGWDGDVHVSHYYVAEEEWRQFEKASKREEGLIVPITENGEKRRIVLATPGQAERFMQWMEDKCRDGYLTEDHVMEPRIDTQAELPGVDPEVLARGMRPFYSVVREVPYARVMIDSVPPGAYVYLNGILRGETPLLGNEGGEPGVKVKPGKVELVLEAVGFNRHRSAFDVTPNFRMPQPLVIQLE